MRTVGYIPEEKNQEQQTKSTNTRKSKLNAEQSTTAPTTDKSNEATKKDGDEDVSEK